MKIPTMQALRCGETGVESVEVRRVRPASGEVLVRVGAVAVDRRDGEPFVGPWPMHGDSAGGRTMGRHIAGTVVASGAGVDGWPTGRTVVLQPEVALRRGWFRPGLTHDGGLADYVVAPEAALVVLPNDFPLEVGAVLPLAARAHSSLTRLHVRAGKSVGVWGVGSLGKAAVALARAMGAAPIVAVDPDAAARDAALNLGADIALDPAESTIAEDLAGITAGRGLEVALHVAPDAEAAEQAWAALSSEGRAAMIGPAPVGGSERWDARILLGLARVDRDALPRIVHLVQRGRLRLATPPSLPGGLDAAARHLDRAVRGGAPMPAYVVAW